MGFKTEKVSDDQSFWNILLYADSGAGKTVFALKGKKVLVLAPEDGGLMSAARMGTTAEKIPVNEWEDMIKANNDLWSEDGLKQLKDYDVLVVDSITEMDSMIMRYILKVTRDQKLAKDTDPDHPWIDDYGKRNILLEKMVRSLNDLPINVFYTALPRIAEDPDKKEFVVPMIGGNKPTDFRFAMKIVALMTSYGYMRVEEVKLAAPTEDNPKAVRKVKRRVIYWEDTSFSKGKDRTLTLTPKTINFTMAHLQACIAGLIDREGKKISTGTPVKTTEKTVKKVESQPESAKPEVKEPKPEEVSFEATADEEKSVQSEPEKGVDPHPTSLKDGKTVTELHEGEDDAEDVDVDVEP